MSDPRDQFDLGRFVEAQRGVYDSALRELRDGRKTGHWIWYIFPQVSGLGSSAMSERYAIGSLDEARAYAAHPVLGTRLRACAAALMATTGRSADELLGSTDAKKLRSSMTLFHLVAPEEPLFRQALDRFFDGIPDPATEERSRGSEGRVEGSE